MGHDSGMDLDVVRRYVDHRWDTELVDVLSDYIRIPNLSPAFDPAWADHGHMDRAVDLISGWLRSRPLAGATVTVERPGGLTPLIVVDVPGTAPGDDTVLLYGHLDKQPEMVGWRDGLGPWEPVVEGDRLYGRGGADDGYAAFAAATALEALAEAGGRHRRCVLVIEASEESGSPDLGAHVDRIADRLGDVSFVVCLDSGCADWDRLWLTTSLRGLVGGVLRVEVLTEGIHSGASGAVPSPVRIARALLDRVEDPVTGRVNVAECHGPVPPERIRQAERAAAVLGDAVWDRYPFVPGARPAVEDPTQALLASTWAPALSVIGVGGLPEPGRAGNVIVPAVELALSMRLPPTADPAAAAAAMEGVLCANPPYGARVRFDAHERAQGWDAPPTAPWLAAAAERVSTALWGAPAEAEGMGGTIPFMGMLGERFPDAQFAVMGVLGPGSNAHGPNEFLHLPTARRITAAVAALVDAHARR